MNVGTSECKSLTEKQEAMPESQLPGRCWQRTALKSLSKERIRDSNLLPLALSNPLCATKKIPTKENTNEIQHPHQKPRNTESCFYQEYERENSSVN